MFALLSSSVGGTVILHVLIISFKNQRLQRLVQAEEFSYVLSDP